MLAKLYNKFLLNGWNLAVKESSEILEYTPLANNNIDCGNN